jgi:hypothetical protein
MARKIAIPQGNQVVYLCGGIDGLSDSGYKDWKERAKELLNCKCLDPMRRAYKGRGTAHYRNIVEDDVEDIHAATHVIANITQPNWRTAMEIVYSYLSNKPILAFTDDIDYVNPWLRFHCTFIYGTIETCCNHINSEGSPKYRLKCPVDESHRGIIVGVNICQCLTCRYKGTIREFSRYKEDND